MNARYLLMQLLKQANNSRSGSGKSSGGFGAKGILKSGAMGMLLGSKRGRLLSGALFKYGLLFEAGKFGWQAWQRYRQRQQEKGRDVAEAPQGVPFELLGPDDQERRGLAILRTMIAAANADGHIDDAEMHQITDSFTEMGADGELNSLIEREIQSPSSIEALAREADSQQAAIEMYLAAISMINEQNADEREWLNHFATALGLEEDMALELERQTKPDID
ncbi:tellurite resistance TerB family protein [Phytohalomonas tamaricis]|uniref:tellurite resistance TerB family protein n=1 Tax=Phytohalomonas tamaricis TaxID=2081032 RepID=UPI000D0BA80F|nr:tellurite resistance TerB family protein [Phytohalomonas tamaricis]